MRSEKENLLKFSVGELAVSVLIENNPIKVSEGEAGFHLVEDWVRSEEVERVNMDYSSHKSE